MLCWLVFVVVVVVVVVAFLFGFVVFHLFVVGCGFFFFLGGGGGCCCFFEGVGLVTIKSFQINISVCTGLLFEHWKSPFIFVVFKFQFVVE